MRTTGKVRAYNLDPPVALRAQRRWIVNGLTRINTNLVALKTQAQLARTWKDLGQTLERLSTGPRINRGADDPAALIASETLRRRAVGISTAIDNSRRADHFIATAEGALAEVAALLLEIKELTIETANSGGMTAAEIKANQLQIDKAINSIDRVATMTTFGGRNILDGSMGYTLSGVGDTKIPIEQVRVNHAVIPESSALPIHIEILTEGNQAEQSWTMRRAFLDATIGGTSNIEITSDAGSKIIAISGGPFTPAEIVQEINNASGETGITASLVSPTQIDFVSNNYGPSASLNIKASQPAAAYWAQSADFLNTTAPHGPSGHLRLPWRPQNAGFSA
ncbi:MAG: hypothetical protein JSU63_01925, partial [Phycisphaerales bacterium]